MRKISKDHRHEWPIVRFWYTKHRGLTIEQLIDKDLDFFLWAVCTFQNVTPTQAEYFEKKTGHKLNDCLIQDVEPYDWQKGDPDELYMEICETQDLHKVLDKYHPKQLELF